MTKRKRTQPTLEELLARPWCYYCERDFDDPKILQSHQKAKHFKCGLCRKSLNTAGGLRVHMQQVHKEVLLEIENTLPGRNDPNLEIFLDVGIPEDVLNAHNKRITAEYFRNLAARRLETGNAPPGLGGPNAKKSKIVEETSEQLQQRLAAHKAKRQAEKEGRSDSVPLSTTPGNGSGPFQAPDASPETATASNDVQHHGQDMMQPGFPAPGMQMQTAPGFSPDSQYFPPPMSHPLANSPVYGMQPYPAFSPPALPFAPPPFTGPPGWPQMPSSVPHMPGPAPHMPMPGQTPHMPMPFRQPQTPNPYSPTAMPAPGSIAPPKSNNDNTKPQAALETSVPGLPARPVTNAPSFSREDMARLHAGAPARQNQPGLPPGAPSPLSYAPAPTGTDPGVVVQPPKSAAVSAEIKDSLEKLLNDEAAKAKLHAQAGAGQNAQRSYEAATTPLPQPITANTGIPDESKPTSEVADAPLAAPPATLTALTPDQSQTKHKDQEPSTKKQTKKGKHSDAKGKSADGKSKMVYSDNSISPEEKMALLSRYSFDRNDDSTYVLDQPGPAVTGAVRGPDDVLDTQGAH